MLTQILCFLIPPTVVVLLSSLLEKKKPAFPFTLFRWVFYAFTLYILTAIALVPFDRATVNVAWTGVGFEILYIYYGTTAILFSAMLSLVTGVSLPWIRRKLRITEISASANDMRSAEKRPFLAVFALHSCFFILLFLTFAFIWSQCNFGSISLNEIFFVLTFSLKGTSKDLLYSFFSNAGIASIVAFAFFELWVHAPAKRTFQLQSLRFPALRFSVFPLRASFLSGTLGLIAWLLFLIACANQSFQFVDFVISQLKTSEFIEQEYVDPNAVSLTFPEEKRNLITIYIESGETTSQDVENGGIFDVNYIPEMTRIAKEHVSFSHSEKLEGATIAPACGWTIAGLVAQTSGLPLKMANNRRWVGTESDLTDIDWFMNGATTMGDLLKEQGYRNLFMAGSDFAFGGRLEYYTQHGQYEILDYFKALEVSAIPQGYFEHWGFEDRHLYRWAKEVLTEISQDDQPFHFSMLTVDTHTPSGYACELCPDTYPTQFENSLACSSLQLNDFIEWCKTQPFFANTSIVITGDHGSMVPHFYEEGIIDGNQGSTHRKIYNVFINSAVEPEKETGRQFTTLDFFPTTLASIGVSIEGERLGLGTNLFSSVPTLAETYGYDTFFEELSLESPFFNEYILEL